ncbi:MAG: undecaprenyldiphospho-muramoylpentapeptide beta-N-acetylglucosaminyltransferase, partial [Alphaproteobacteria bacterium]
MSGPIVLAAGGTGGHVFPAQALAAELASRGRELALVTDRRGADFGDALGGDAVYTVRAASVSGHRLSGRLRGLAELALGLVQARRLLRRLRPAGVVGFGGYASVPTVLAATQLGLPTVIHEQNAVLGRANRLLAPRVRAIATAFAETAQLSPADRGKSERTGNPVRPALAALADAPYPAPEENGTLAILVTGGSLGATVMAEVVPRALASLPQAARVRLRVTQQCRAEDIEAVRRAYDDASIAADLASFFDDLPRRLATAQLVIARAGASTVAEVAAVGRPAILVPYPVATDDHQTANARALERAGGAWTVAQSAFTPEALAARISAFLDWPSRLAEVAAKARAAGAPEAAVHLADLVERRMPV